MLLWHGSRLTNWVGILSQGLRIAPPEAPVRHIQIYYIFIIRKLDIDLEKEFILLMLLVKVDLIVSHLMTVLML